MVPHSTNPSRVQNDASGSRLWCPAGIIICSMHVGTNARLGLHGARQDSNGATWASHVHAFSTTHQTAPQAGPCLVLVVVVVVWRSAEAAAGMPPPPATTEPGVTATPPPAGTPCGSTTQYIR